MLLTLLALIPLLVFVSLPLAIIVPEIRSSKTKWICPTCGNTNFKLFCISCGNSRQKRTSYAGFRKRFASMFIDGFIVLIPVTLGLIVQHWFRFSRIPYLIVQVLPSVVIYGYMLYFTSRYGQTIGKFLVGIRIMKLDLKPIGMIEAVKREAINMIQSVIYVGLAIYSLTSIPESKFATLSSMERLHLQSSDARTVVTVLTQLLIWSELLVLMMNKKRRALHDYVAGTVVVDDKTLKRKLSPKYRFRFYS